jgi:hypothetical protein
MSLQRKYLYIGLGLLWPLVSIATDWPQWRGPARDGVISGISLPDQWPDQLKKVWTVQVGLGHASPLVAGDKIYVHARQEKTEQETETETVWCISLKDGQKIWHHSYAAPYTMNSSALGHGPGPKSTPLLHQGRVSTPSASAASSHAMKRLAANNYGNTNSLKNSPIPRRCLAPPPRPLAPATW